MPAEAVLNTAATDATAATDGVEPTDGANSAWLLIDPIVACEAREARDARDALDDRVSCKVPSEGCAAAEATDATEAMVPAEALIILKVLYIMWSLYPVHCRQGYKLPWHPKLPAVRC